MVNLNSYWCHMIIFILIFLICIEKSSSQFTLVSCYECTNCTDPFNATSSNVTIASGICNTCYKLSVDIAYAPYRYVIRRCLEACLAGSQSFGGGSVISSCCASNLCNTSSMLKFSGLSRFFFFIFIIFYFLKYSIY